MAKRRLRKVYAKESVARCEEHINDNEKLGDMAWYSKSDESHKAGIGQSRCPECGRYFWPWEIRGQEEPGDVVCLFFGSPRRGRPRK